MSTKFTELESIGYVLELLRTEHSRECRETHEHKMSQSKQENLVPIKVTIACINTKFQPRYFYKRICKTEELKNTKFD
jgi:hypothetical protein